MQWTSAFRANTIMQTAVLNIPVCNYVECVPVITNL